MDAKDEVKQRLSVEEVVADYIELKRAGRNFKAISPFTNEKTASFMVSPEKQIWHDFSSNKGGDIFSFIMEVEGVDFREALEILAKKANVDLSQYQTKRGNSRELKNRLLEATELAVQFYHICLSKQAEAVNYIKEKRGYNTNTIRNWRLGYSPENGTALYKFLKNKGFSEIELSKAGLITKRRGGWSDMFRGRIMIPLCDAQGAPVGFTARLLKNNPNAPKYFNTPATLLYDKGRQVFGLHHAKEQIRKQDRAILVEGNLDVIASHQAGVTNVVACAGTAMTADHLRSLGRLSPNIILAFDADEAGIKATERAIPIAQNVNLELKIATLPDDAKDPDELIQSDVRMWQHTIDSAVDAVSWVLSRYEQLYDKSTAEGKRQLSTKALEVVRGLQDPVELEHHIRNLAQTLQVSPDALVSKLQQKTIKAPIRKPVQIIKSDPDRTAYEDDFLALNITQPSVRESLRQLDDEYFSTINRRAVFGALRQIPEHQIIDADLALSLHLDTDYVKILILTAEEKYVSFTPADSMAEAMALARRISKQIKKNKQTTLTAKIDEAERIGDSEQVKQLLSEYQALISKERHGR